MSRLIITFDDSRDTDYSVAFPLLRQRGLNGTYYTIAGNLENMQKADGTYNPEWMTVSQTKYIQSLGADIQHHSYAHPKYAEVSTEEMNTDLSKAREAFQNLGFAPRHMAYPNGSFNASVKSTMLDYDLVTARTTQANVFDLATVDLHEIPSVKGDVENSVQWGVYKSWLDTALDQNRDVTVYWHRITNLRLPWFIQFLDYVKEKPFKVMTMSELYFERIKITQ